MKATTLLAIAAALLPGTGWADTAAVDTTPAPAVTQTAAPMATAKFSAPAREVLKLVQSGVPEPVVKAYVDNSASTFSLTTDNLISLQGMGVSSSLMAEMLTHDKALKDNAGAYAGSAAMMAQQQPQVAPMPQVYPQYPQQAAVSPDYSSYYTPPLTYPDADYSYSYPYYPAYYPYGYSYFPSFVVGFGGRFGHRFDGRFGGFNRGGFNNFGVRAGFSPATVHASFGGGGHFGGFSGGHVGGHR